MPRSFLRALTLFVVVLSLATGSMWLVDLLVFHWDWGSGNTFLSLLATTLVVICGIPVFFEQVEHL
jgi:hypothetical protein